MALHFDYSMHWFVLMLTFCLLLGMGITWLWMDRSIGNALASPCWRDKVRFQYETLWFVARICTVQLSCSYMGYFPVIECGATACRLNLATLTPMSVGGSNNSIVVAVVNWNYELFVNWSTSVALLKYSWWYLTAQTVVVGLHLGLLAEEDFTSNLLWVETFPLICCGWRLYL